MNNLSENDKINISNHGIDSKQFNDLLPKIPGENVSAAVQVKLILYYLYYHLIYVFIFILAIYSSWNKKINTSRF